MSGHDRDYLLHIRDFIVRVQDYTKGGKEQFFASPMIQDAVVRNIELIGEAVKNISAEAKGAHPEIPWQRVARMRDKIIHHYFGLDLVLVWEVVEKHIPELQRTVEVMLQQTSEGAAPQPASPPPASPPEPAPPTSSPAQES